MIKNKELRMEELAVAAGGSSSNNIRTVDTGCGGYTEIYTSPAITGDNAVPGCKLYVGDTVEVLSNNTISGPNRDWGITVDFIAVRVIKNNAVGYINADYIR